MKQSIARSHITAAGIVDFDVAVAAHAHEMRQWRAHMALVDADQVRDLPAIERHVPYPRPRAHLLVESAVNESDEADFEIIDDGPTPEQTLAARKQLLLTEVSRAEEAAIEAIVPSGKRRLLNMRENDVRTADAKLAAELQDADGGILSKFGFGSPKDPDAIAAQVAEARPSEDTQLLADQQERRDKISAIQRAAAQAHHDIEDLTAETIGAWSIPSFN